ncbi:uncharacterized protein LOC128265721 [Drosophila gunungcola]|uniref:Single domain-containing protein n=1 Tax=Drosophila gunungcola TaxID=103775 RepID=A0A9P9YAC1_9MUSC|nr:uncharacterized protein LOC128265721 [Drosophila gunungcola]KAI8033309.1 hypothetical protein M5D96_013913 [Drosophila gunungcola]
MYRKSSEMDSLHNIIYIVLLTSLIIGGSQAAMPYRPYVYNQQFCMDTLTGQQLYIGEVFTRQGQCVRVQCLESLQLWEDSCQVPNLTEGDCRPVAPPGSNTEYPRCCPLYECKSYESYAGGTMEKTNTYDHYGTQRNSHLTEVIVIGQGSTRPSVQIPAAPVKKYQV